jgi:hypothetical protein
MDACAGEVTAPRRGAILHLGQIPKDLPRKKSSRTYGIPRSTFGLVSVVGCTG